ncbi:MAG: aldo/keto reductase [Candidatus Edwardsbacteria bacterium]|nr:aldo/keto reductase [Candidatus Edwardsbacteria bacterium]
MHKGFATIEETEKHLARFSFRESKLRQTPWFHTPAIGIGTSHSQGADPFGDSELFQRAVEYALKNGINFIDTALNYRGMKSEREIGRVLNAMVESDKTIERNSVIIATKAGIIPGDIEANLPPAKYLQEVLVKNGVIQEKDVNFTGSHNRHVMAPGYYRFAINKSREHLGVETIDIHYIHNPEISPRSREFL